MSDAPMTNDLSRPQSPQRFFLDAPKQKPGECYVLNVDYMVLDSYCSALEGQIKALTSPVEPKVEQHSPRSFAEGYINAADHLLIKGAPEVFATARRYRKEMEESSEKSAEERLRQDAISCRNCGTVFPESGNCPVCFPVRTTADEQ